MKGLKDVSKIWINQVSVSSSGMSRKFDVFIVIDDEIVNVNREVSSYASKRQDKEGHIIMKGAGMDMAFALTYELSQHLHGDGYKLKYSTL